MIITRKHLISIILIISNFMIFLDSSILPVALPTIQKLLNSSNEQLQWMVNSYLLAVAIFVAIGGRFADIFGHKKIFILGIIFFGFFSLLCGLSRTNFQLIVNRFFQGIGSALMYPSAIAILFDTFSEKKLGKTMGLVTAFTSIGFSTGPLIGGFFVQYLSWRYIFFINIPIAIIGLIISLKVITQNTSIKEKVDMFGFFSFGIGITCLILVIMQSKKWGIFSALTISLFIISIISFFVLYFVSKRKIYPFINFSIFKIKPFFCMLITIFTISISIMITVFWIIFFQNILLFSPIKSGALIMISSLPMIFFSNYAVKIEHKYGTKISILSGQILILICFLGLMLFMPSGNIAILAICLLLFGIGRIMIMLFSYKSGVGFVPENKRGEASGILTTFRSAGTSLGIAILGAIFFHSQFYKFSSILSNNKDTANVNPNLFKGLVYKKAESINALKTLSSNIQIKIENAMQLSYNFGISFSNLIAALIVAIGSLVLLYYFKPKTKKPIKKQ